MIYVAALGIAAVLVYALFWEDPGEDYEDEDWWL